MWLHLCSLLAIGALVAMLVRSRRKGAPFHGQGFSTDTYRESAQAQLSVAHSRIRELEGSLTKQRERARLRDYIIFHLWRRNSRELVGRAYWLAYTRFCGLLAAVPWPSVHLRQMIMSTLLACGIIGGVFSMAPTHAAPPHEYTPRSRALRTTPTMLPVQFTWGGEVETAPVPTPWTRTWLCHQDVRLHVVVMESRHPQCGPELEYGTFIVPAFFLKDEREWLVWIHLTLPQHEPAPIVFTLN